MENEMRKWHVLLFIMFLTCTWAVASAQSPVKSDVYLQGFYWNSPPGGIWYDSLAKLAPRLASAGFGGIWFPSPVKGAGGGNSMGYDPYDHYDFGDYNQKGSVETRFGSKAELLNAIKAFHTAGVQVFADAVLNHMMGGESSVPYECKPSNSGLPDSAYLIFNYPFGSGRFKKDASFFYPNSAHCNVTAPYHGPTDPIYRFGEWLDKEKKNVQDSLIAWGVYLRQTMGFDGFRLDAVKSIDPNFMGIWLKGANTNGYAVAEDWSGTGDISAWQAAVVAAGGGVSMFDFPLRYALQDMCNTTSGGYDMRNLDGAGCVNAGMSGYNVATFVENHDFDRIGWDGSVDNGHNPVYTNKDMAYAYIIFSEGRPCVFFKDYFDYGFKGKIDTLIWIRAKFLGGGTTKRDGLSAWGILEGGNADQGVVGPDFYVARRDGYGSQKGGYLVINDNASKYIDVWVNTNEPIGTVYKDFTGKDVNKKVVGPDHAGGPNRLNLFAPARSYTIYVADTSQSINYPPVISTVPDMVVYTNAPMTYKALASDANDASLTYSLTGNPTWLSVSAGGVLSGTPAMADTGSKAVVLKVADPKGLFAVDTFTVSVIRNFAPHLTAVKDTVIIATKRFDLQVIATDADKDSLLFTLTQAPSWLNIGMTSGMLSATPAVKDTGAYAVKLLVTDHKGGYDSLGFKLTVRKAQDSVIHTYGKPLLDGVVNVASTDWLAAWQVTADPDTDSKWKAAAGLPLNNEIMGLFATWDADSLYLGVSYVINDSNNTMMVYLDAGLTGGCTNFNSTQGYNGAYPKNMRFRPADGVDYFIADYLHLTPSFYKISGVSTTDLTKKIDGKRGPLGHDLEAAIAWNDIYGLGAGKIPPGVKIKMIGLVAGGDNYGAGDSSPDNPTVDGTKGPDSLINLAVISPDVNNDGLPDPTVIISDVKQYSVSGKLPDSYNLYQNYPNPFNPTTRISYDIPEKAHVRLTVFDVLGKEVQTLVNDDKAPGSYSVEFSARSLASGVYIYKLSAGSVTFSKKFILLK